MNDGTQQWYYVVDGERCGPLDRKQLQSMFDTGSLALDTLVWAKGMDEWKPAVALLGKRRLCPSCGAHLSGDVPCDCTTRKADKRRQSSKRSTSDDNHFAVAGFVVSLIALPLAPFTCGLSAIPAMVFSIMGLVHTFNHPMSGRRALAIMGLLISLFSFLLPVLIGLGFILFFSQAS